MDMDKEPSAADYYKSWTAYDALTEAAEATSFKSVWNVLSCDCCVEPQCWKELPVVPLPPTLRARIRWYDHARYPEYVQGARERLSEEDIHSMRERFVSHHQRIELILYALRPSLVRIYDHMKLFHDRKSLLEMKDSDAATIIAECEYTANGWIAVGRLVSGVAKLDRMKYLSYVPSLAGVSGGNSPNMMTLTSRTGGLESFFGSFTDEQLADVILTRKPSGRVAEAFIDCLDALSRCWFDHVVTATTAIGITRGTKGKPNTVLADMVLRRLHGSRLLKVLGSLRSPISGIGIEMHQLHDYQMYPLAHHYLDLFDDPGSEFGTHSVGFQPREYELARADFLEIRRTTRTAIWEHFYSETRPAFCQELSSLLGFDGSVESVGFGLGSSVTEVLARIVASLRLVCPVESLNVVVPDDDFVTFQRAAALLGKEGASITRVRPANLENHWTNTLSSHKTEKKDEGPRRQLFFVSLVNSCTQKVLSLESILNLPSDAFLVLDVTQAVSNIPLCLAEIVSRPNVFVIGSMVKHARCGEGLGFMTFSRGSERTVTEPASGWTAHLGGLRTNETADPVTHVLLYDEGFEWDGGSPSYVEAAYVAARILKAMPPVKVQHEHVRVIKNSFIALAKHLLSEHQMSEILDSESNTMAIPVSRCLEQRLAFGLDYKVVNGTAYLRIGFGIHNLEYHLVALVEMLEETGALR